jgi:hypothetical protein
MKWITGLAIAAILLSAPRELAAKDYCVGFNSNHLVFKGFSLPAKGACKPISAVFSDILPGYVASGSGCRTSDGKIFLFTLSATYGSTIDGITGTIIFGSNGVGAGGGGGNECDSGGHCLSKILRLETCPKKPAPITAAEDYQSPDDQSQL